MLGRTVIAVLAAAVGTSVVGTASAAATTITYQTGDITLSCLFPLVGNQPVVLKMQFDAPDAVATGDVFTPAKVKATATVTDYLSNAFGKMGGNKAIRGTATAPVTSVGLSPSPAALTTLRIPTQPFFTFADHAFGLDDAGATIPAFTVTGAPGTEATVRLSGTAAAPITMPTEWLKETGAPSQWLFKCTIKSGTPDFSPKITIKS